MRDTAIGSLWRHQADVLRNFVEPNVLSADDVAIELPTGSGKTLVGGLIGEWRRQTAREPVALVCLTRQLARDAHDKLLGYGIDAVLLTGRNAEWPQADRTRGLGGEALIVTNYSSIFNANPQIRAGWLLLDDAHGAESFVASRWSLELSRDRHASAYRAVISALTGLVEDERLLNDELDPGRRPPVTMVGPDIVTGQRLLEAVDEAGIGDDVQARFALDALAGHGGACAAYVDYGGVLIRPWIVPTFDHPAFDRATQRVYLSATLGQAGELERVFGRTRIVRIAIPSDQERRGTGRRLVLAPGAHTNVDADAAITTAIAAHSRALVLTPSYSAAANAQRLVPRSHTAMTMAEAGEDSLERFVSAENAVLIAANRYDGIDLPGQQCQLVVLEGLPTGTHLQERFLAETVGAGELLRERIRARILQGMGRATRSRADRAIVLLSDRRLIDFVVSPANRRALRPDAQGELAYAVFVAGEGADLATLMADFLDGDEALDAHLQDSADEADLTLPPGAESLATSAPHEVRAARAAWRGDFAEASDHAMLAARALVEADVAGTRTIIKVLGAAWAVIAARQDGGRLAALRATELVRDAKALARSGTWRPVLASVTVPEGAEAGDRAVRLLARLRRLGATDRILTQRTQMLENLSQTLARPFERGLEHLGTMLGFESIRPGDDRPATPDGAWRDGALTIALEAKSEQRIGGELTASIIRQANSHGNWIAANLGWPGDELLTLVISPKDGVGTDEAGLANADLHLVAPEIVAELAARAAAAEEHLASRVAGLGDDDALRMVQTVLDGYKLATADIVTAFRARPIRALG